MSAETLRCPKRTETRETQNRQHLALNLRDFCEMFLRNADPVTYEAFKDVARMVAALAPTLIEGRQKTDPKGLAADRDKYKAVEAEVKAKKKDDEYKDTNYAQAVSDAEQTAASYVAKERRFYKANTDDQVCERAADRMSTDIHDIEAQIKSGAARATELQPDERRRLKPKRSHLLYGGLYFLLGKHQPGSVPFGAVRDFIDQRTAEIELKIDLENNAAKEKLAEVNARIEEKLGGGEKKGSLDADAKEVYRDTRYSTEDMLLTFARRLRARAGAHQGYEYASMRDAVQILASEFGIVESELHGGSLYRRRRKAPVLLRRFLPKYY
jgi:hypothetical protein